MGASHRVVAQDIHSLCRTRTANIYRQTGDPGVVQILLGHTKIDSAAHCLEVDVEDALALSEGTEI